MARTLSDAPIPLQDPIARPGPGRFAGLLPDVWIDWFTVLTSTVNQAPNRLSAVELTSQGASIGATDFSGGGVLNAGLYRVTYYARITRAAGTSSSLTVTLSWTDGGASCSFAGAAITGNTTTTIQSETKMIRIDSASPVRYATTYASVGMPTMLYSLDVTLEQVKV
jgi:hypothetical protein